MFWVPLSWGPWGNKSPTLPKPNPKSDIICYDVLFFGVGKCLGPSQTNLLIGREALSPDGMKGLAPDVGAVAQSQLPAA